MTIVTRDPHSWFVCKDKKGNTQTVYNNERYEHNYPFTFEVNFADIASPQKNTVTLYNMSKEHRQFYKKGMHCYVAFNWGKEKKILAEGYITKIDIPTSDGVTESQQITFTEGTDYNNVKARTLKVAKKKTVNKTKKAKVTTAGKWVDKVEHYKSKETYKRGPKKGRTHEVGHIRHKKVWQKATTKTKRVKYKATETKYVNKTFPKKTDYKTIIKGVASQAKIKIAKIDLAKNPKVKRPFTAKGKPLNLIKKLVADTGSKMLYERGKLVIINPKTAKRSWFVIDDQDLIQPPSYNEDSDNGKGEGTWEINVPLVPEITTQTGIIMKSKYLKGKYYVKAGQHTFDGENPQTQCSLASL